MCVSILSLFILCVLSSFSVRRNGCNSAFFQLIFIFMFNACLLACWYRCFFFFTCTQSVFTSSRNLFYGLWFTQCSCDYICSPLYTWNFCLVCCTFIASPPRIDYTRLTRICSRQRDTHTLTQSLTYIQTK